MGTTRHVGPLRVLQSLYPEGPAVCHHVLVHPPGGIAGGDELEVSLACGPGSHAVLTTPGATRMYRSAGAEAVQSVTACLDEDSRLEWVPLETIVHDGAQSTNALSLGMKPSARAIVGDLLVLGLPASQQPFLRGRHVQRLSIDGLWLDHACIDAQDHRLLHSPVGWAGHGALGTLVAACGSARPRGEVEALLETARRVIDSHPLSRSAGATALADERGALLRVLAHRAEPAMQLLRQVWMAWRPMWIGRSAIEPRLWRL